MSDNYKIYEISKMLSDLKLAVANKTPFSVVCLGDAEQIFLACPEVATINDIDKYLAVSGVDSSMVDLKKEIISLLPTNNYIWTHSFEHKAEDKRVGQIDWAKFFYIYPEIFKYYSLTGIKLLEKVSLRYGMIVDGSFFDAIAGSRVLLIGHHAPEVEKRMKNPEFVKYYEKMNLHKINVLGSIGCAESKTVGSDIYRILDDTKRFHYDVALMAMGIPSTFLGPILKRYGKIAIDIGHIMSALAGQGEEHRSYINEFSFGK